MLFNTVFINLEQVVDSRSFFAVYLAFLEKMSQKSNCLLHDINVGSILIDGASVAKWLDHLPFTSEVAGSIPDDVTRT